LIPKITTVLEYEDFWGFEYPEDIEIDDCPPDVKKNDGSVFAFFFPLYADKQFSTLKF